jgi:hypothetical protein
VKILHVIPALTKGGAERVVLELANEAARNGGVRPASGPDPKSSGCFRVIDFYLRVNVGPTTGIAAMEASAGLSLHADQLKALLRWCGQPAEAAR